MLINRNESVAAKWGISKWDGKGVLINAKSETYENSRFWGSFANNRCLVPAHGYYEWQPLPGKKKVKYSFKSGDKHGVFMAGIYDKQGDFAIITKPANENLLHIHPRMPLTIRSEQAEEWLSGRLTIDDVVSPKIDLEKVG
jgi:putative SOS response-associated peptidase YedK